MAFCLRPATADYLKCYNAWMENSDTREAGRPRAVRGGGVVRKRRSCGRIYVCRFVREHAVLSIYDAVAVIASFKATRNLQSSVNTVKSSRLQEELGTRLFGAAPRQARFGCLQCTV